MPQKTYSIANFNQTSSWTVYKPAGGYSNAYSKSPTSDTDYASITLSDIPVGSTINSAYIEATFGSPSTGINYARIAFSLSGGAYSDGSAWDDTVNPRTEPIPVAYLSGGATTSFKFSFKANGSLGSVGSFSGTLGYSAITVYVDYTEPYSKCTPPTAISVTPSSTGKSKAALLSWSGAGSGTNNWIIGYDVYASTTSSTSGFSLLASVTASPLTVTSSATNGGQIYYKIVAKGEAGATYYSDLSSAYATLTTTWTNATAPSSVTGPTNVVPGSTQTISWSGASAGTNNAIVKYQLYRDGAFLLETTSLSASVTAHAINGSSYVYTVKTVAEENSVLSTASHTMLSYVGPVTAPSSVSFDANNLPPSGQTTLRWGGQAGGINNEIEDFDVETSNDNTNWTKLATTANSAYSPVTSSATNNATIYYRVKVNGERSNAYSSSIGLVTTVTKPTAPTSVSLNDNDLPVGWSVAKTLSWSGAAAGTNNAIYGYRIMVSVNDGALTQYGADIVTANTSGSVSVTSLSSNGTQKFYVYTIGATSVTAEKLSALSTANDTLTTTVTNPTAPTASIPTNVAPGSTQSLSWSGGQNGTNNPITTYKIYEKIDAGSWAYKASEATSPYTVTASSTNGGKKSYYIISEGANGDSAASSTVVMETTVSKPNAPTTVSLSATSNLAPDADVTLSWSGASNATYNNPISGYRIMRSVDGGAYAQLGSDLPSSTSSQVVKTKNGNGAHAFRVIALGTNLGVHSDMSTPVATATTVVSTPAPPSIVEVPGGGGVAPNAVKTLQWSGAAAGTYNNPIKGYQVYRSTDGTNYTTFGSPILTANTSYSMNVTAQAADGASYYYKVVTLGNTLSINSAMSSAYGILTTVKVPSTGSLNKTSVVATGTESIGVTVVPQLSTYTHKVTWYIDGTYTSGEISKAAGVTSDTYTIPQSWILATTKTTTSVTAKCKVETFDGATSIGVNEYTFTVNVPTKSTFALSGVPLTADGTASATATITSKYSGYKHTILWSTTGYSQTHNVVAGTSTKVYAIPKAWCNAAPNVTSFTVTVKVTTIKATADGDLSLGDETTTFTANVPTDIVPTITSFTATGVNQNWGLYVCTKSSVQWAPVAAGAYSSTIVSYKIENAYLNSGVLNYSTNPNWTSGILNYAGSQVFTLTVTDSRGRTASTTGSITVTNYNPPSIASAMFVRANSGGTIDRNAGTYINLAAAFTYSDIGSNDITAKAYYREVGTTTWLPAGGATVTITGTAPNKLGSVTYGSGSIVISKLYDVKVALTDAYSTVEASNVVPTVARVFDFRETKAAFGGMASNEKELMVPSDWQVTVGGRNVETPFVVGIQTTTTATWTGVASTIKALYNGLTIRYWLPTTSAANVTLNLTLADSTTTGSIPVYYSGTTRLATHYAAGNVITLTYVVDQLISGVAYTGWWAKANYTDGNNFDRMYWGVNIIAGSNIYDYKLVMEATNGKWYPLTIEEGTGTTKTVSTQEFLLASPILYYSSTTNIAADKAFGNVYSEINTGYLNRTANQASWTSNQPIYLKGTVLANGNFKLDNTSATSFMTQTLPTTDDGFVYVLLGYMYGVSSFRLLQDHPKYQFKDGALRAYIPKHVHGNVSDDGKVGANANLPIITGTGGVLQAGSFGTTANTFCQGNDVRLSDARTPVSHPHGNITNDGKIGTTASIPIITGTNGVLQAGAFGNSAGQFCQGNDARLSDARVASDVSAWAKAATKPSYSYSEVGAAAASHPHGNLTTDGKIGTTANIPLITGTGGIVQAGAFGNTANTFVQGNDARLSDARTPVAHPHGNITNDGKVGTVADKTLMTGENGVVVAKTMAEAISIWKFSNKNLLDNWDFRFNPINQRGASGTITGNNQYFYDRWMIRYGGTVTVAATYLSLPADSSIRQYSENANLINKVVTVSVMIGNVVYSGTGTFPTANGAVTITLSDLGTVVIGLESSLYTYFTFTATTSTRQVQAVKLELGTVSTLAYDPPMDYGMELAKCQRFFRYQPPYNHAGIAIGIAATSANAFYDFDMRVLPTVTHSGMILYDGASHNISGYATSKSIGGFILHITSSDLVVAKVYRFQHEGVGSWLMFSADL